MRLGLVIAWGLLTGGCPKDQAPAPRRLEIELLGRRFLAVRGTERTLMYDREQPPRIRIHPVPDGPISVRFEGPTSTATLSVSRVRRAGRTILRTKTPTIAPQNGTIVVEAEGFGPAKARIRWVRAPGEIPMIGKARAARGPGHHAEAERIARAALEDEDPITRYWAAVELARAAYYSGDLAVAVERYVRAAEVAEEVGLASEVIIRRVAAANLATERARLVRAKTLLDEAARSADRLADPVADVGLDYARGILLSRLGDLRQAGRLLRRAAEQAVALDDPRAPGYRYGLARHLLNAGRLAESVELLTELVPENARLGPAAYARALNNLADAQRKAYLAGALPPDWDLPKAHLERALALIRPLHQPGKEAIYLFTLAAVELERKEIDAARRHLDEAIALGPYTVSAENIDAIAAVEIRLASGDVEAGNALLRNLEARGTPLVREAALHLQAKRAAAAKAPDALARFRAAFALMNANARRTALQGDRAGFLASRRPLLEDYLSYAVDRGALEEALVVADAGHSLLLQDLDADVRAARLSPADRTEWTERVERYHALRIELAKKRAACDRLPSKRQAGCTRALAEHRRRISRSIDTAFALLDERAGGLTAKLDVKALHRALDPDGALILISGRHAFFVRNHRVVHASTPVPLEARLDEGVKRLFVVGADLTERTVAGKPLPARVMLAHLPSARLLLMPPAAPAGPRVFAGDPTSDLPGARREVQAAARPKDVLLLGPAATRARALRALAEPSALFHFAGHAQVLGEDPWQARLTLADGALTLEDLLVAQPAARVVVLSACASGAETGPVRLPHPFLLGGARAVLATRRPLADAEAGPFLRRFYEANGAEQPLQAFRTTVRSLVSDDDSSWSAFILFAR